MQQIQEYSDKTSFYELFTFIFSQVMTRKVKTFSELVTLIEKIPNGKKKEAALRNGFILLRELNWGFFDQLSLERYPKLWKELTLPDRKWKFGASLKRNMNITSIYIAFVDIHGYTAFCHETRNNLSLLKKLDSFIENDLKNIAKTNNVLSRRVRGDELILLGTSAINIVDTVVQIADFFSKKSIVDFHVFNRLRTERPSFLPTMTISAGIAGGQKYTPLLITEGGDLSGSVVNTAARLQNQANKSSGNNNGILLTHHVSSKYKIESKVKDSLYSEGLIDFLDQGKVSFKGISLTLNELVFDQRFFYKKRYIKEMEEFQSALTQSMWDELIFVKLMALLAKCITSLPKFSVEIPNNELVGNIVNNDVVYRETKIALQYFVNERNYEKALESLGYIIDVSKFVKLMDNFVLLYCEKVYEQYSIILESFKAASKSLLDKEVAQTYSPEEKKRYLHARRSVEKIEAENIELFNKINPEKRRKIWAHLVTHSQDIEDFKIDLGK